MAYEKTLIKAEKHMTKKYDAAFAKVEGLRWYPWVGKNYDKGRVLILGMSTYDKSSEFSDWRKFCETSTEVSRVLVSGKKGSIVIPDSKPLREHKPFMAMSKMFIGGTGKKYGTNTARLFWESVAFNNHCQEVVIGRRGKCPHEKKEDNNCAFRKTLEILKPSLCLVWTTQVWRLGFGDSKYREHNPKINRAIPRIVDQPSPIVGIRHPSQFFSPKEWLKFLREDEASKSQIEYFIAYLQSQPVE